MIKCSICSYQCDNWYVSNWRLACHINFYVGRCLLELAQEPLRVALAWHLARRSTPFGVTLFQTQLKQRIPVIHQILHSVYNSPARLSCKKKETRKWAGNRLCIHFRLQQSHILLWRWGWLRWQPPGWQQTALWSVVCLTRLAWKYFASFALDVKLASILL